MLTDSIVLSFLLIFLCLLLSAFFSSSEVAFISLQRLRLRHLATTEKGAAEKVAKVMEKPEKFLTTILLGNNLVNTAAAVLATVIAVSLFTREEAVLIATVSVTVLLLIFGEIAPKTLATRHGEKLALLYAPLIRLLMWLLSPVSAVFVWIGDRLARLAGAPTMPQALVSEEEIRTAISAGVEEGTLEETEAEMVEKVFRFGDRHVHEAMTTRTDVILLEQGVTLREFLSTYAQSPHSRFPIYETSVDNVVGILGIKDVLMALAKGEIREESPIGHLARPAYFVPESKPLGELFAEMQATGSQMVVVIDEFGGTVGLATLEQLIEEIMGQLGDELRGRKSFETIDENTFEIDGAMRIGEINEELGLGLPEGEYETVAGFILHLLGRFPKVGEEIRHDGLKLVIKEMKGLKIEKVLMTKT